MLRDVVSEFLRVQHVTGKIVVGVSGGADSVALLYLLYGLLPSSLVVCHVNHHLRGAASDADEAFVVSLSQSLSLPCVVKHIDPADEAGNLEAVARRLRYAALLDVAHEHGAAFVTVAHHADDQAETMLHHVLRGTGLAGLRGIAPVRALDANTMLIRPLLQITKQDMLNHLSEINAIYRTDESNADGRFTRNRLRVDVLPLLMHEAPQVVSHLATLAEQAREAEAMLHDYALETLAKYELPRSGAVVLLDAKLEQEKEALIRIVLRSLWEREHWPRAEMTATHWHRAAAVVRGELTAADFPQGMRLEYSGNVVRVWWRIFRASP